MSLTPHQAGFKARVNSALTSLGATEVSFSVAGGLLAWRFQFLHQGIVWPLKLVSADWDFNTLPAIYWDTETPRWAWPHISRSGDVCISDGEGLDYDPDNVKGVCRWTINEALLILTKNDALTPQQRAIEFADELEGYLQNLSVPKVFLDDLIDDESSLYAEVNYRKIGFTSMPFVKRINTGTAILPNCRQETLERVDVDICQLPAINGKTITKEWWEQLCVALTPDDSERIKSASCHGVLFRVKNSYGYAVFLIHWAKRYTNRPFGSVYLAQRRNVDYLVNRTGQTRVNKKVTIIGCGAVGSRVAEHLTLAAVTKLTLIDHDKLTIDNIGRHVLGKQFVGQHKTTALTTSLSDRLPGVEIVSIPENSGVGLTQEIINNSDAIVLATGNAPVERAIIRRAFKEKWQTLIVSTSVEAGGLGGHAISMTPGIKGCLECLYIDPDTLTQAPWMRTSLIKLGQKVTKQLTGCGSFTPYSSLDATKTAIIAVELVLSASVGYKRWAGTGELALSSNIEPSDAHELLLHNRIPTFLESNAYAQEKCSCCNV